MAEPQTPFMADPAGGGTPRPRGPVHLDTPPSSSVAGLGIPEREDEVGGGPLRAQKVDFNAPVWRPTDLNEALHPTPFAGAGADPEMDE